MYILFLCRFWIGVLCVQIGSWAGRPGYSHHLQNTRQRSVCSHAQCLDRADIHNMSLGQRLRDAAMCSVFRSSKYCNIVHVLEQFNQKLQSILHISINSSKDMQNVTTSQINPVLRYPSSPLHHDSFVLSVQNPIDKIRI